MINTTDILLAWQRIGWNEPSKAGYTLILDTNNKTSLSGLKFDALHALSNFVNVKDTYPDSAASSVVLNALLTDWQKAAIVDVATSVFKSENRSESGILNDAPIDFSVTQDNNGLFVGWKIVVPKGYVLTIKSVELLFDSVATFNLYVFNESKLAAVATKSVDSTAGTAAIVSWGQSLYGSSSALKSGTYYVGYIQATAKAIQRQFYGKKSICGFSPIQATANGVSLPDSKNIAHSGYTFGLNFDYAIEKDFTNDYLNYVSLFDKAIGINVVCKLLEQIHFSPRINTTERQAKESLAAKAFLDLNGSDGEDAPYVKGLLQVYLDEIKNIRETIYRKPSLTVCTIK